MHEAIAKATPAAATAPLPRRCGAGTVRVSGRDVDGLILCGEMYGAPYDLLAAGLNVQPDRLGGIAARWRAAGYAETGQLGPGPAWCWLTRPGLAALGLRFAAGRPPPGRLAHLRAVLAARWPWSPARGGRGRGACPWACWPRAAGRATAWLAWPGEEAAHVLRVGLQGPAVCGAHLFQQGQRDLAAGQAPGADRAAADQGERAEHAAPDDLWLVRAQHRRAGLPAVQQRVEHAEQPGRRERRFRSPRPGRSHPAGGPAGPGRPRPRPARARWPRNPRRASRSGRPAHFARSRSVAGAWPAR